MSGGEVEYPSVMGYRTCHLSFFNEGHGDRVQDRRHFTVFTASGLNEVPARHRELEVIRIWTTNDARPGRTDQWVNALVRKQESWDAAPEPYALRERELLHEHERDCRTVFQCRVGDSIQLFHDWQTMTAQDHKSVSEDVRELLTKTYDLKLMDGGTAVAIGNARDAYDKASTLPQAGSHWRQLAAYRLAHLLLRQDGSLPEIDELLSIAEGADFLEPLRSFCHLAVLHRMRDDLRAPDECDAVTARLEKVFDHAIDRVKPRVFRNTDAAYKAQDSSFNTLELLSYALGLPHDRLGGISGEKDFSPYRERRSASHAWQILSQGFKSVWMTEEFARREFASRISAGSCVAVEITRECSKWAFQPSEESEWKTTSLRHTRLIAALLSNPEMSLMDLRKEVADDREPTDRFKKAKQRTKDEIQELVGKQLTVFKERSASKMFDLTGEIRFLVLRNH